MKESTPAQGTNPRIVRVTGYRIVGVTDDTITGESVTMHHAVCPGCKWHAKFEHEARDSAFADLHEHGTKHHLDNEEWWFAFGRLACEAPS